MNNFQCFAFFCAACLFVVSQNWGALGEETTANDNQLQVEADTKSQDVAGPSPFDHRTRIIENLFKTNKYCRFNYPTNTTLQFGLALVTFDIDEEHEVVRSDGWIRMKWTDPRFKWEPSDFGGETVIRFPASQIWRPDISVYNMADHEHGLRCRETNVLIYNNGVVLWIPSCQFDTLCGQMDLNEHPYGPQNCTLTFGTWTYDGHLVNFEHFKGEKVDLTHFTKSNKWDITDTLVRRIEQRYSCCAEPYIEMRTDILFQRKPNTWAHCY